MNLFFEIFSQPFVVRALVVGVFVSVAASILGVSLVLKNYSMLGDGLSHVGFSVLAIASVLNLAPILVSIPIVIVFAIFLLRFSESFKIKGDSAIALVSTSSLSVGIVFVSAAKGMNVDVLNYMFGSIIAIGKQDLIFSVIFSSIVVLLFVLLYNGVFSVTFDEEFAKATGVNTKFYTTVVAVLTAIMIVVGMKIVGALLMSGLIVFPALISMRLVNSFKLIFVCSVIFSVFCFVVGLIFSYFLSVPPGAMVVLVDLFVFIICSFLGYFLDKRRY